ncbi:inositol-pentakisphosphate 2-kinase-like [Lethenteron reissneri]|uniref:inositol-pentakisphosphate 2-kinase-like n=1 Tax=Lethenteron reissneri TaxID=7753 RepID=UPI002AB6CA98|nr:inositol-pentakisphosphate 2-kinase-like [Lethenteron reissneri]
MTMLLQGKEVLKFLKFPVNAAHGNKMLGALPAVLDSTIVYTGSIMAPLLGKNFVHAGEVVSVPRSFARSLAVQIESARPESRHDSRLDEWSGLAVRLPNLTRLQSGTTLPTPAPPTPTQQGPPPATRGQQLPPLPPPPPPPPPSEIPTFCIEIKPKCGFLPGAASVVNPLKRRVCRYCMQQYLKVANGKCRQVSDYCPLDLYSGDGSRMSFAIRSLMKNSQNNFRVFKLLAGVYGPSAECRQQFYDRQRGAKESPLAYRTSLLALAKTAFPRMDEDGVHRD